MKETKKEASRFVMLMKDLIEYNRSNSDTETASDVKTHNIKALQEIFGGIGFIDEQGHEIEGIK